MKNHLGIAGLIVGLVAVALAIFQNEIRDSSAPAPPPPKEELSLKEVAAEAGKKLLKEKILKETPPPPTPQPNPTVAPRDTIAMVYTVLGFIAMGLGIFSWVKKDHIRISGGAVSLGLMAIAWQYVLIAVAVAVVIIIISNISV